LHEAALRVIASPELGPQLGPKLFFITGQAIGSRFGSLPILIGWLSEKRNDCRSPLVELANTINSVKGGTKRGIAVKARAGSPIIWGAFTHFLNGKT
jgi:hypothetical protein